jgi:hypothetical protein
MRSDPASYGANNFRAGERIMDVIDARPTLGEFDRLGAMWATVPDLTAGTMTYTWAKISAASFDPATHHAPVWSGTAWADPVAKSLALLKAEKTAAITARRWEVETGGITLNGAAIATDAATQAKLSGALQLVQDDDTRVLDWKGVNGWISLNAAGVTAIAVAVGLHVQACFTREKDAAHRRDRRRDHRRSCAGRPASGHHRRRGRLADLTLWVRSPYPPPQV